MRQSRGTVEAWFADDGWGFIRSDDLPDDLALARSEDLRSPSDPISSLSEGEEVEFSWEVSPTLGFKYRASEVYQVHPALHSPQGWTKLPLSERPTDIDQVPHLRDAVDDALTDWSPTANARAISMQWTDRWQIQVHVKTDPGHYYVDCDFHDEEGDPHWDCASGHG